MTKSQIISAASLITGTLSSPSKMPCSSYSIPAARCITGSKLRNVDGSTCSNCYACKGQYRFSNVQDALETRFSSLRHTEWIPSMVAMITAANKNGFFRWHDSGDLQGVWHLRNIVLVCMATPEIKHWLPTREYKIVADYLKEYGSLPANLTVRLSAHMVDGKPAEYGLPTSTVHSKQRVKGIRSHVCPAPKQGNKCMDCRACWDSSVKNVSYHIH